MVEIRNVYKSFGKKEARVEALKGVSLSIEEGELVAIMGKSGSGKSTLLNILGGMMSMDSGEYLYDNQAVNFGSQKELTKFRRNEVGFVVQYFALADDLNVFQNVALPLKYQGYSRKKIKELVMAALRELEIEEKAKAYPSELSGGQQQRAAIARAIVKQPRLILADEPTGALDEATGEAVQEIFRKLNENGKTVIIVTHDAKVAQHCGRIVYVRDGMIAENEG
ncbi:MAG: ABC transporter ATP-binding protein [Lachnospiraceae bacterium]|nr:ABC transporter ATP-binding protein [Lachnospiraceae bacterium]